MTRMLMGCCAAAGAAVLSAPALAQAQTDGPAQAAAVVQLLDKVCAPLIASKGEGQARALRDAGVRDRRGEWMFQPRGAKPIAVTPPSAANRACTLTVAHDFGAGQPILDAVKGWAARHDPPLAPFREREPTQAFYKALTSTWTASDGTDLIGLVLAEEKNADDTPVNRDSDQISVIYSYSPLPPPAG